MATGMGKPMQDFIREAVQRLTDDLDRLIRTPEGRKELAADCRKRAQGLREFAARGDFRSHCPWPTAEPYLRNADELDAQALKYDRMRGSKGLWER